MRKIIISFIFVLFPTSAAYADVHAREVQVVVPASYSPAERADAGQAKCVNTFFGQDLVVGVGGDGTVFAGVAIPGNRKPFGVVGLNVVFSAALNIRISQPVCQDPHSKDVLPPTDSVFIAPRTGNGQWYFSFGLGAAALSLLDLASSGGGVNISGGALGLVGLRHDSIWWSTADDNGSKHVVSLIFGVTGGFVGMNYQVDGPSNTATRQNDTGALLGGYVGFQVSY